MTPDCSSKLLIRDAATWVGVQQLALDNGFRHEDGSNEIKYPMDPENDMHVLELCLDSPTVDLSQLLTTPVSKLIRLPVYNPDVRGIQVSSPSITLDSHLPVEGGARAQLTTGLAVSASQLYPTGAAAVTFNKAEVQSVLALATETNTQLPPVLFVRPGSQDKWKTLMLLVHGLGWRFHDKNGTVDEQFLGIEYYDRRGAESTLRIDSTNNALRFSGAERYVELGQVAAGDVLSMSREQLPTVVSWLAQQYPNNTTKASKKVSAVNQLAVTRSGDNVIYGSWTIPFARLQELARVHGIETQTAVNA